MTSPTTLASYLSQVANWLAGRSESSSRLAAQALSGCADRAAGLEPRSYEPPKELEFLDRAIEASPIDELAKGLRALQQSFFWRTVDAGNVMHGRSTHCKIVGPDGTVRDDTFLFGSFLIVPDTVYPLHSHAARETYVILSGQARWWNDDAGYRERMPGEVIVHEPWQPHAMRTDQEPLLTLWIWQGDISFDSYRYEPAGLDEQGNPL